MQVLDLLTRPLQALEIHTSTDMAPRPASLLLHQISRQHSDSAEHFLQWSCPPSFNKRLGPRAGATHRNSVYSLRFGDAPCPWHLLDSNNQETLWCYTHLSASPHQSPLSAFDRQKAGCNTAVDCRLLMLPSPHELERHRRISGEQ